MKKLLFSLLVLGSLAANAQVYNNEWIDFTKTYYKFRIGADGVFRISGATLGAAGLGNAPAQQLQLWRNGVQVPVYTSVAAGPMASTDFIEFWGQMNDGKPDKELYRDPAFQVSDKWSLISDSATYFLTVNPSGNNLRLLTTANNVAGNTLPAEPYFMHTAGQYFRNKINPGLFYLVNTDHLYSSSYDRGEGWSSDDLVTTKESGVTVYGTLAQNFPALFPATTGPSPSLRISVSGNAYISRRYKVTVNGDSVMVNPAAYLNDATNVASFNLTSISSGTAAVVVTNLTDDCGSPSCALDRMVVQKLELTYPRQFNFGNAANFEFGLAASATGNYLEISGFSHGGVAPVLYDLTNGKRYVAEIAGPLVKLVLEPSATARKLILVSQSSSNISSITSLQSRSFINYSLAANQADYLIISNPILFAGANGTNPVEDYRAYRSSAPGGSYNARLFLEDQITDQFGFGIKKNPAGVRNLIRFARSKFAVPPKQVFIIGRGVHYLDQLRFSQNTGQTVKDNLEKLNLVPTYGWPASDMLLAAEPGLSLPATPIGRLTAITPAEVATYLKKVKETELAQQSLSPSIPDKVWMKNVAHIVGAGEADLDATLSPLMVNYQRKIEDTLYGAKVSFFRKTTANLVQQLNDADLTNLWNTGISLITYYGHSSATTLEYNLDDPGNYNNQGKYPMFFALGCNAGNTFDFNEGRFSARTYLSDKYVLAPDRGSINFLASTHFGIVHYLDFWNSRAYNNIATVQYRRSIGEIMQKTIADVYAFTTTDDFFARCNAEQTVLNGDPAVGLNQQVKPDYAITDSLVRVNPSFISVAEQTFKISIQVVNLGKAINRKSVVETKRQYPDGTISVVRRDTLNGTRYLDTLNFNLPIDPIRDKGSNKIFVTVDADNAVDELFETNNSTFKEFVIFEDEARAVYPQDLTILNKPGVTLKASTANPFGPLKQYRMEVDTTDFFNSPLRSATTISSTGGLLEFTPAITFTDSTVYYWRVAPVPLNGTSFNWNNASFVFINNSDNGYNQSHFYQHTKSVTTQLRLDSSSRTWRYDSILNNLTVRNGVFGTATGQESDLAVSVNGVKYIRNACAGNTIVFNIFNPNTFKPRENPSQAYGSDPTNCAESRLWNFAFDFTTTASRKRAMDFMDSIPNGYFVVVRNILASFIPNSTYINNWKADEAVFGTGISLYHKLKNLGFATIDSFNQQRVFSFIYQKGTSYTPSYLFTDGAFDVLNHSANMKSSDSVGYVRSPAFGPAKSWKQLIWRGKSVEAAMTDRPVISITGTRLNGSTNVLATNIGLSQQNYDVSAIDAAVYPYLTLTMQTTDSVNFTPYQLGYWRLTYDPVPEGALAPNVYFTARDTVEVGEPLSFNIAFKNITDNAFTDSIKVRMVVTDRNNVQHVVPGPKLRKLGAQSADTLRYTVDTKNIVGINTLFVDVNPANDQPEQYHFNNFAYRNFYVKGDTLNPLLDVTFDNVHILNRDIVSSKPDILIKLKDEAKWMLLNDPADAVVQVRFPDGVIKTYAYNSDTLVFTSATGAPNARNEATIRLRPYFAQDGDYELIVTGKDGSDNAAGAQSYKVGFQVINKAMISNMLNYPNPFTTSTAFVFTLTGIEVPQNIKIEVLTITGKIVREITKAELGPLHIGRNITEFKWDGTDQYGSRLANGVYLYRVVTNLNGKSLEKYKSDDDNTEKYFNKGYGKMYLMR